MIFWDINLVTEDGISIIAELRSSGCVVSFIFVTSYENRAIYGYDVYAFALDDLPEFCKTLSGEADTNDVFFKNYCNLNIFGAPVYYLGAGVAVMTILAVILSAVSLFIASHRIPETVTVINLLSKRRAKISEKMP